MNAVEVFIHGTIPPEAWRALETLERGREIVALSIPLRHEIRAYEYELWRREELCRFKSS